MPRCNACGNYGHVMEDCVDLFTVSENDLKADLAAAKAEIGRYEAMMVIVSGIDMNEESGYRRLWREPNGAWWTWVDGPDVRYNTALEAFEALQEKTG